MNKGKTWAVVPLALLLAVVAIWLIPSHRVVRSFVLPQDGTTMSFYKATLGAKTQQAIYATDWRDHFARIVPAKYASKLGFSRILWASPSTNTNDLIVVLKRSGQVPGPAKAKAPPVISLPRLRVTVVGDDGLEADYSALDSAGGTFVAWAFANYPRRSRTIHLRFWDARTAATNGAAQPLLAEMEIPNPAPGIAPPWAAETLPAVRVTNGLEIALLKLETGLTAAEVEQRTGVLDGGAEATNSRQYSLAQVDIRDHGQPATGWQVREIQAVAPTGVSPSLRYVSEGTGADADYFYFFGVLWPEEPTWEVTIVVDRPNISPEDVWSIANIPMPGAGNGNRNAVAMETNMAGMHLIFHGVSSAAGPSPGLASGSIRPMPVPMPPPGARSPLAPTSTPFASCLLGIALENYSPDVHLLLSLQTDNGPAIQQNSPATIISASREGGAPTASYTYNFLTPAGATKYDATLRVTRYRSATIRVKPTLAH